MIVADDVADIAGLDMTICEGAAAASTGFVAATESCLGVCTQCVHPQ